jgi:hypothetical protein
MKRTNRPESRKKWSLSSLSRLEGRICSLPHAAGVQKCLHPGAGAGDPNNRCCAVTASPSALLFGSSELSSPRMCRWSSGPPGWRLEEADPPRGPGLDIPWLEGLTCDYSLRSLGQRFWFGFPLWQGAISYDLIRTSANQRLLKLIVILNQIKTPKLWS